MGSVYIAHNFSHSAIYILKHIKNLWKFDEVLTETKMHSFLRHSVFSRFDRISVCDRQTDGQTDILRRHSPRNAYASLGKNKIYFSSTANLVF